MTQQPYGYPQQQYPQQFAQQPVQQMPQQPAQYPGYPQQVPQQQFAPQYQQLVQQPVAPLADGSLDAFYGQPNTGGGPGVSWKGKPDGYTVQGVVPRDVSNADVTQEVGAPNTQQAGIPQTYRDGRPKFVMAVPLQVQASQEFPEGEARLFVRGQLRDELARAMAEAGADGAPKAGAVITVTLVQRKQGRGTIPQNVFAVRYTPAGGQTPQVQQPTPQPQQPAYQAPVQQQPVYQQPIAPQFQQPQPVQPTVDQTIAQQAATGQPAPQWAQDQQPAPVAQQPQPVQQGQPQFPEGMTQQQADLLAKLTNGQQNQPQVATA